MRLWTHDATPQGRIFWDQVSSLLHSGVGIEHHKTSLSSSFRMWYCVWVCVHIWRNDLKWLKAAVRKACGSTFHGCNNLRKLVGICSFYIPKIISTMKYAYMWICCCHEKHEDTLKKENGDRCFSSFCMNYYSSSLSLKEWSVSFHRLLYICDVHPNQSAAEYVSKIWKNICLRWPSTSAIDSYILH